MDRDRFHRGPIGLLSRGNRHARRGWLPDPTSPGGDSAVGHQVHLTGGSQFGRPNRDERRLLEEVRSLLHFGPGPGVYRHDVGSGGGSLDPPPRHRYRQPHPRSRHRRSRVGSDSSGLARSGPCRCLSGPESAATARLGAADSWRGVGCVP